MPQRINGIGRACLLLAAALLALGGCGQRTTVHGRVEYGGKPVDEGWVTFQPGDGEGPSAGGRIERGTYRVTEIAPGEKIVSVRGGAPIAFAQTSEEMARQAGSKTAEPPNGAIPRNALGNNVRVHIAPGDQAFDLHLQKPAE